MENQLQSATELMASTLDGLQGVRAVFHNGSQVVGSWVSSSDIEFTIILDDAASEEPVAQRIGEVMEFIDRVNGARRFRCREATVCVNMLVQRDVEEWIDRVFESPESLREYQGALRSRVLEATPLVDPDNLLEGYHRKLADYPESLAREVANQAIDDLRSMYLDEWQFRNLYHFGFMLSDILTKVGIALYAVNRQFYMAPLKRMHADLTGLQPDIEQELRTLVSGAFEEGLMLRRRALESIVGKLRRTRIQG